MSNKEKIRVIYSTVYTRMTHNFPSKILSIVKSIFFIYSSVMLLISLKYRQNKDNTYRDSPCTVYNNKQHVYIYQYLFTYTTTQIHAYSILFNGHIETERIKEKNKRQLERN